MKTLRVALSAIVTGAAFIQPISWAAEGDQGRAYFVRYCASCHGIGGKGDGTVSRSLKVATTDLTQLQKRNKGVFPVEKVMATIDGRTKIEAHGESKMPVWGEVFERETAPRQDAPGTAAVKVKAITEYIATLQR